MSMMETTNNNYKKGFPEDKVRVLKAQFPSEQETLDRLEQIFYEQPRHSWPARHLLQLTSPVSLEGFTRLLSEMRKQGLVENYFSIYSPRTRKLIQEVHATYNVPLEIEDPHDGNRLVQLSLDDVIKNYRLTNQ